MTKLEKIIEYGLYLLAFLLPVQTRWIIRAGEINGGYSEYGTISLYGTDILLILLLGLFIVYMLRQRRRVTSYELRVTSTWWLIAGLELFVFISIFFAPDKLLAVYHYGVFLLGVGLFWLVTGVNYDKLKLVYAFLCGALVQAGFGLWQFFSQSSFASKWLGMAAHDPRTLGTSVVELIAPDGIGERWLRAYGGLDHPNILGGLLAVGILLAFYSLVGGFGKTLRNQEIKKSGNWQFIFLFFVAGCLFMSLFFTFSRGAWIGASVGVLVMLAAAVIGKNYRAQRRIFEAILAGSILICMLCVAYGGLVRTRMSADTRLEVKSNTERLASYGEARKIIKSNWLFGVGIGNYASAVHDQINAVEQSWYYQPTHNTFLLIWAETGIFGLIFFLAFMFHVSCFMLRGWRDRENMNVMKLGIPAAIVVMMMVDHWWWSSHFGMLLFWLVMGIIYARDRRPAPVFSSGKT